jgi:hypothetical protein
MACSDPWQMPNQCVIERETFARKLPDQVNQKLVKSNLDPEVVVFKPRGFKLGPEHNGTDRQV